jgi:hypothetical protein
METKNDFKISTPRYRYLSEDQLKNPLSYLEEVCSSLTTIELFRLDLHDLARASLTDWNEIPEGSWRIHYGHQFVSTHRQLTYLIEALFALSLHPELHFKLTETDPFYQRKSPFKHVLDIENRIKSSVFFFRKLGNDEMNEPCDFLIRVFKSNDLSMWHEVLDDLLGYAYSTSSLEDAGFYLYAIEILEKMIELCFLVSAKYSADITQRLLISDILVNKKHNNEDELREPAILYVVKKLPALKIS